MNRGALFPQGQRRDEVDRNNIRRWRRIHSGLVGLYGFRLWFVFTEWIDSWHRFGLLLVTDGKVTGEVFFHRSEYGGVTPLKQ